MAVLCLAPGVKGAEAVGAMVVPGLDVLMRDHRTELPGKRLGLLCNHTTVNRNGRHAIDLMVFDTADLRLKALFSPEHGIKGRVVAGKIADDTDPVSGLPIRSLYGETRKPTPAMLADIDLVLIDLQDVGARFYTYASTMALMMEACGEAGIPVWVLDRPNPLGGEYIAGPLLEPEHASFLGMYPIPICHGMTMGELAQMMVGEFGVECDLTVVPMEGWSREMRWRDTGLPWIPPSPSLWTPESALAYPGTCFFEGTNLSLGGSTYRPYEVIGAPWLQTGPILEALRRNPEPGVEFAAIDFTPVTPNDGKYEGEVCHGIALNVTDPELFDPVGAGFALLELVRGQHPDHITFRKPHLRLLFGSDSLAEAVTTTGYPEARILSDAAALTEFSRSRAPYLLYQ